MRSRNRNGSSESGAALLVTMLLLLVLTIIGLASMQMTAMEIGISGNEKRSVEAFYAAEAGLRRSMSLLPDTLDYPVQTLPNGASFYPGTLDGASPSQFLGLSSDPVDIPKGYNLNTPVAVGVFKYQVNVVGESPDSTRKELEAQAKQLVPLSSY